MPQPFSLLPSHPPGCSPLRLLLQCTGRDWRRAAGCADGSCAGGALGRDSPDASGRFLGRVFVKDHPPRGRTLARESNGALIGCTVRPHSLAFGLCARGCTRPAAGQARVVPCYQRYHGSARAHRVQQRISDPRHPKELARGTPAPCRLLPPSDEALPCDSHLPRSALSVPAGCCRRGSDTVKLPAALVFGRSCIFTRDWTLPCPSARFISPPRQQQQSTQCTRCALKTPRRGRKILSGIMCGLRGGPHLHFGSRQHQDGLDLREHRLQRDLLRNLQTAAGAAAAAAVIAGRGQRRRRRRL